MFQPGYNTQLREQSSNTVKKIAYHQQVSQEYLAIDFTRWFPNSNILQGDIRCKILVNTKADKENTT